MSNAATSPAADAAPAPDLHARRARVAPWFIWGGMIACALASLVLPEAVVVILFLAIPWLALPLAVWDPEAFAFFGWKDYDTHQVYEEEETDERGRANLMPLLYAPIGILAVILEANTEMHGWKNWIFPAIAGGLVMMAVFYFATEQLREASHYALSLFAILAFGYAAYAAIYLNRAVDRSQPRIEAVELLGKSTSFAAYRYYFETSAPWTPTGRSTVKVTKAEYDKRKPGDRLCAVRHRGLLGLAWHQVRDCAPGELRSETIHSRDKT